MKIVVISCDKNKDLFEPYYLCMEKYWKEHPEIIYSTETITNPYYKTICKNIHINNWTKRVYETLKKVNDKYVLLMVDDIFLREKVDNERILNLQNHFTDNVASINLEKTFDINDTPFNYELMFRSVNGKYKTSVMCNLFDREKLMSILNDLNCDPWTFESINHHKNYTYLISKNGDFLNFGYGDRKWFGIRKGKWCLEIVDFFNKENIKVDYNVRGFYQK